MSGDLRIAIRSRVLSHTQIANTVGTRVYPLHLPQGVTYPAITFQKISDVTEGNLSSVSRIRQARIQFDTWATTAIQAARLAEYIREQFDGFQGTVEGVHIATGLIGSESDLYEDGVEKYRVTADYQIVYYSV